MSDSEHVKGLVKEAELYRRQGLYRQAMERYLEVCRFAGSHPKFSGDSKFMEALKSRLSRLEGQWKEVEAAPVIAELSGEIQKLIERLFSSSGDRGMAGLEGAIALAGFGQYDRAMAEFRRMIREGDAPLLAAIHMLSCQLEHSAKEAVSQLDEWIRDRAFSRRDLSRLRQGLEDMLRKKGMSHRPSLPEVSAPEEEQGS